MFGGARGKKYFALITLAGNNTRLFQISPVAGNKVLCSSNINSRSYATTKQNKWKCAWKTHKQPNGMLEMEIQFKICRKNRISTKKKFFFLIKKWEKTKIQNKLKKRRKKQTCNKNKKSIQLSHQFLQGWIFQHPALCSIRKGWVTWSIYSQKYKKGLNMEISSIIYSLKSAPEKTWIFSM